MLSNDRFVKKMILEAIPLALEGNDSCHGFVRGKINDRLEDVLFNTFLRALWRAANLPTITVAHKLVNNIKSSGHRGVQDIFWLCRET